MISRKIWGAENSWNFQFVYFPIWQPRSIFTCKTVIAASCLSMRQSSMVLDGHQWYIPVESYFIWLCSFLVGSIMDGLWTCWSGALILRGLFWPSPWPSRSVTLFSLTNSTCCFKNWKDRTNGLDFLGNFFEWGQTNTCAGLKFRLARFSL